MRIVIDLQACQTSSRFRGIGRYSMSLTQALIRNRGEHEIFIVLCALLPEAITQIREMLAPLLFPENIMVFDGPQLEDGPTQERPIRKEVGGILREAFIQSLRPDITLITSLFEGDDVPMLSVHRFDTSTPVAVILYDLIPLIYQERYLDPNPQAKEFYLEKIDFLKQASLLLSISNSSRQEAIDYLDTPADRVVNMSSAADPHFYPKRLSGLEQERLLKPYDITRPFVMYTGGGDSRKNIEGLIRAYALLDNPLRLEYQLVIVCSLGESEIRRLGNLAREHGMRKDEVIFTNFVSEDDLIGLYNSCMLFVFPSVHEGFGLPALEAMACKKAVLVSNCSSLPEVVGREDMLFDPKDDQDIANKMQAVLRDPIRQKDLEEYGFVQAQNFSWDKSARIALQAMQALASKVPSDNLLPHQSNRLKLAYISPLPDERSGIASYSAELLPYLNEYYQIDVISRQVQVSDPWIAQHCKLVSPEHFVEQASNYDRVLYHFGNSTFHEHMFALIKQVPGVVVQHDFFISNLIQHLDWLAGTQNNWLRQLYDSHGYGALWMGLRNPDPSLAAWTYPVNRQVLQDAYGVIFHSPSSLRQLVNLYGSRARQAAVVIPHLRIPKKSFSKQAARERLEIAPDVFMICSFGLLFKTKANTRLLKAFIRSTLIKDKRCQIYFVGECPEKSYHQEILDLIKSEGLQARVHITGWVDDLGFQTYLEAADMAVQLRTLSRGETSGTVLDCLNHSLPTVINASGTMQDFAPEVVWKLEEEYPDEQLVDALEALHRDEGLRKALGSSGKIYLDHQHDPANCAKQYFEAIERFYRLSPSHQVELHTKISEKLPLDSSPLLLADISTAVANTFTSPLQSRQLLIDVTALIDDSSIRSSRLKMFLQGWLLQTHPKILLEPIYHRNGRSYYAREFCLALLDCPAGLMSDEPIQVAPGDVLMVFGGSQAILPHTPELDLFKSQGNRGLYFDCERNELSLAPDCFHQHILTEIYCDNSMQSISQGATQPSLKLSERTLVSQDIKIAFDARFWEWVNGAALNEDQLTPLYENTLSALLHWMDDQRLDLPVT